MFCMLPLRYDQEMLEDILWKKIVEKHEHEPPPPRPPLPSSPPQPSPMNNIVITRTTLMSMLIEHPLVAN